MQQQGRKPKYLCPTYFFLCWGQILLRTSPTCFLGWSFLSLTFFCTGVKLWPGMGLQVGMDASTIFFTSGIGLSRVTNKLLYLMSIAIFAPNQLSAETSDDSALVSWNCCVASNKNARHVQPLSTTPCMQNVRT